LRVVLYGCETWSLTLREEHRLKVFENGVVRRIFGPKRDEIRGRKVHNEELHNLYTSPDIIKMTKSMRMRWVGHVACMGERLNAYRVLVGKPEGKTPLGGLRCRWEGNVEMDIRDIGWGGTVWINLTQSRDQWWASVNAVMNLQVP
jgi:hypothetical protein